MKRTIDKRQGTFSEGFRFFAQQLDEEADSETKTVFEELAYELRNIENCLTFLVDLASNHSTQKQSLMDSNQTVTVDELISEAGENEDNTGRNAESNHNDDYEHTSTTSEDAKSNEVDRGDMSPISHPIITNKLWQNEHQQQSLIKSDPSPNENNQDEEIFSQMLVKHPIVSRASLPKQKKNSQQELVSGEEEKKQVTKKNTFTESHGADELPMVVEMGKGESGSEH